MTRRDLTVVAFAACCAAIGAIAVTRPMGLAAAIMLSLALWAGWRMVGGAR